MRKARESQILELLSQCGRMEVSVLAQRLGVSQVTVRKDLDALEERGILRREHGFAVSGSGDDVNNRLAIHYEEKRRIARRAARLVSPGETVMIESGSCCALLADVLVQRRKDLTILTNSAFIASYIRGKGAVQTILLGGIYQPEAQVMVGPMVRLCAEGFFVSRFFIGVDGWSARTGFTNQDHMRAQAVRDMAGQAERVVVLTESEKFTRRGVVPLNLPQREGQIVVTSRTVSEEVLAALKEQGIEVCLTD